MIEFFPSRAVAIELFGFGVHWYGLLYFLGFLIGWYLLPRLQKFRQLSISTDEWSNILTAVVIGVIVGGRLGYVLFYEPVYFMNHPLQIFAVWNGGMSSHGGFIGVTLALLCTLRKKSFREMLSIADIIVIPVAIGLALGRLGNFINQELYGSVTTLPWGIVIPGEDGLRHPTQVYAMIKDLLIASICFFLLLRSHVVGRGLATFLVLYGVLRFLVEYLRIQTHDPFILGSIVLTRGQLLTIPLVLVGMLLWIMAPRFVKRF